MALVGATLIFLFCLLLVCFFGGWFCQTLNLDGVSSTPSFLLKFYERFISFVAGIVSYR
nr:MAG TPA: hypothetical protein [Caudoviricetes sp.]